MKLPYLLSCLWLWWPLWAGAQAPARTANDYVRPYTADFQYGSNMGYYANGWTDEALAELAQRGGVHSLRPALPEHFLEKYGYTVRVGTFARYQALGMRELTVFVEGPTDAHRDPTTYPGAQGPSKLFANLYEPIWQADGSVNPANYYAAYLYHVLQLYGEGVRFWEIVNEPDYTYGHRHDDWLTHAPPAGELPNLRAPIFHYIRMLRISYEIIKKYRPDSYVATGGIGYPQFADALLRYTDNPVDGSATPAYPRTGGAYLEVLSFHTYPAYSLHHWQAGLPRFRYTRTSDYAARKVVQDGDAMRAVLKKYGYDGTKHPAKLLVLTETNISRRTSGDRIGSDEMQRNFGLKMLTLAQQQHISQFYIFSIGESVDAPPPSQEVSGTDEINLMGLYENLKRDPPGAAQPTPEGQAFASMARLLYGYRYDATRTAGLALPPGVAGAAFGQKGHFRYVLWAEALTDSSEAAHASYSFPAAWHLGRVQRFDWQYARTGISATLVDKNLLLNGTPVFFGELPAKATVSLP